MRNHRLRSIILGVAALAAAAMIGATVVAVQAADRGGPAGEGAQQADFDRGYLSPGVHATRSAVWDDTDIVHHR